MSYQNEDNSEPPTKRQRRDSSDDVTLQTSQGMAIHKDQLKMSASHLLPVNVNDLGSQGKFSNFPKPIIITITGNIRPSLMSLQSDGVSKTQTYPGLQLTVPKLVSSENSQPSPQTELSQTPTYSMPMQPTWADGKVTLQISPSSSILSSQQKSSMNLPVGMTLTSSGGQRYPSPQVITLPNRQTTPTNSLSKSVAIKSGLTEMKNVMSNRLLPEYIKVTEPVKLVPGQTQFSFQVPTNWNMQGSKSLLDNAPKVSLVSVNQSDKSSRSLLQSNNTESHNVDKVAISAASGLNYVQAHNKVAGSIAPTQIITQSIGGITRASGVSQPGPQRLQKTNSFLISNKQYTLVPAGSTPVMTQLVKTETKLNKGKVTMAEAQIMLPTGPAKISWPIQAQPSTTEGKQLLITSGMKTGASVQGKTVLAPKKPLSISTFQYPVKVTSVNSMSSAAKVVEVSSSNKVVVHNEYKNMKSSVIPAQKNWELVKQASQLLPQRPNKITVDTNHDMKPEVSQDKVKTEVIADNVNAEIIQEIVKPDTTQERSPEKFQDIVKTETFQDDLKQEVSQDQANPEVIQTNLKSEVIQANIKLEVSHLLHKQENRIETHEVSSGNINCENTKRVGIKSASDGVQEESNNSPIASKKSSVTKQIQHTEQKNISDISLISNVKKEMQESIEMDAFHTDTSSEFHSGVNYHTSNSDTYSAINAINWKDDGTGELPGSNIKFHLNELGALEVINDDLECNETLNTSDELDKMDTSEACVKGTQPESDKEVKQECNKEVGKEVSNKDEITQCENCGEYGFATDFQKGGRFCSQKCVSAFDSMHVRDVKKHGSMSKMIMGLKKSRKKLLLKDGIHKDKSEPLQPGKKSKAFVWTKYLQEEKALEAPARLFKNPFPAVKNAFRVGMKLEGLDPMHQSKFCVLSVAEVCGYRVRLHFDGYSECFDFWTDIDSPFIFPVGFCEKNGKMLQPPKGFTAEEFSWPSYLKLTKTVPVPKNLFSNQPVQSVTPNLFRVNSKLEAIDKKNSSLLCVASVADTLGDKVLIHFDSWADNYDYWCDMTSPLIHPVGHCNEKGITLSPPLGWKDNFTWDKFLSNTYTQSVPARAFKSRPPIAFEVGMKVEVVDKRNPLLVRVATITVVENYLVNIHFDGWADVYDYWLEDDSPDIHPPGWCAKTGHPLVPPITPADLVVTSGPGVCPTPGCKGIGHIKGPKYSGHHSTFGCPYSELNMNKDSVLGDRLGPPTGKAEEMPYAVPTEDQFSTDVKKSVTETSNKIQLSQNGELPKKFGRGRRPKSYYLALEEQKAAREKERLEKEETLRQGIHNSIFTSCMISTPNTEVPLCWEQNCKLLPGVGDICGNDVNKWTIDQVASFVNTLTGCAEQAKVFVEEQIDGEAFLMLTQMDIVKIMNIKLGPAIKIFNSIVMFRNSVEV